MVQVATLAMLIPGNMDYAVDESFDSAEIIDQKTGRRDADATPATAPSNVMHVYAPLNLKTVKIWIYL